VRLLHEKIEDALKNNGYAPFFNVAPGQLLKKTPSDLNPLTYKALIEIHKNLQTDLTIADLAERLDISERQLSRVFKRDCGMAPGSYTNRLRIEAAKRLLKNSQHPVREILELIGVKNNSYFFSSFKRMVGMSPEEFRMDKTTI
jgi:YesN/AraC family two-component response regulator